MNTGFYSIAQKFGRVINRTSRGFRISSDIANEQIIGLELGYGYRSPKFACNVNTYGTIWNNKPETQTETIEDVTVTVIVQGLSALHTGIEFDCSYNILDNLNVQGIFSLQNNIWNSSARGEFAIGDTIVSYFFDPSDLKVGNAAQTQIGAMVRYEPIKRLYLAVRGTFFGRHWGDFDARTYQDGRYAGRQPWRAPDYFMMNFHAGYTLELGKHELRFLANVLNLTNAFFITDATTNGDVHQVGGEAIRNTFDATTATVHVSQGIQWNIGVRYTFK
jgi:hypothetical protein